MNNDDTVKVVTVDEWNNLQSIVSTLQTQINFLNGKLNLTKQEEK